MAQVVSSGKKVDENVAKAAANAVAQKANSGAQYKVNQTMSSSQQEKNGELKKGVANAIKKGNEKVDQSMSNAAKLNSPSKGDTGVKNMVKKGTASGKRDLRDAAKKATKEGSAAKKERTKKGPKKVTAKAAMADDRVMHLPRGVMLRRYV